MKNLSKKNAPKKKKITWRSNKKKIANVNQKGVVTAKKVGKANITAKVYDRKYVCKVTVKPKQVATTEATTQQNATTEALKPESPTTPNMSSTPDKPLDSDKPTTPDNITLTNTEGKNADDVAALKKIIAEQNSVSKNLALTSLWCSGNQLSNLDVSKNTKLSELYYDEDSVTVTGWLK